MVVGILRGIEVIYDEAHWALLWSLRASAVKIMSALAARGIRSGIHGSVARGDVDPGSDVDMIVSEPVSSYSMELALTLAEFKFYSRRIAQATPSHTPKAHIYLDADEKLCVTFPLVSLRPLEHEFYRFGGYLELPQLLGRERVPGCDKRPFLIQPTTTGHVESPAKGREVEVAKILGVNPQIVQERIRVLTRRQEIGRTGIVVSQEVGEGETFEEVLRRLARSNPVVARRLRGV